MSQSNRVGPAFLTSVAPNLPLHRQQRRQRLRDDQNWRFDRWIASAIEQLVNLPSDCVRFKLGIIGLGIWYLVMLMPRQLGGYWGLLVNANRSGHRLAGWHWRTWPTKKTFGFGKYKRNIFTRHSRHGLLIFRWCNASETTHTLCTHNLVWLLTSVTASAAAFRVCLVFV